MSSTLPQALADLLGAGAVCGAGGLAAGAAASLLRRLPGLLPLLPGARRVLALAGLALGAPALPAGARPSPSLPGSPGAVQEPPWTRGGDGTPPSRSGVRHPAIHAGDPRGGPLFPRESRRRTLEAHEPARRDPVGLRAARAAHPAGKGHTVVVRAGDTLWDIAGRVLATSDPGRIDAYWPRIAAANRARVPDPDLIYPGQVLRLPPEGRR